MTEYTKEKCYDGIGDMACDMLTAIVAIGRLAQGKREEYAGKSALASDTETDCAIRLKIAAELVAKVREDLCNG